MLKLAPGLKLPEDFTAKRGAIVARSGGGKTYTASVFAEELVKIGQPFYVLDPTGAWWGLRASASGTREGLPVVVVGGDHGDVPLTEDAGAAIADLVVEEPSFYVLDMSGLGTRAAEVRFATAYLDRLYRAKGKKRDRLIGLWDEADLFAPQRSGPDEARMLGAAEQVVRRGRIRGLITWLITQRPAIVNKNVLSQIEVLVALVLGDPRDRKAIKEWLDGTPDPERGREVLDSLAALGVGEAWFYGPAIDLYQRVQVRERRTFNSSGDGGDIEPARLAKVDVAAVRDRLAKQIAKAEKSDPKALQRKIDQLEKALAQALDGKGLGGAGQAELDAARLERDTEQARRIEAERRAEQAFRDGQAQAAAYALASIRAVAESVTTTQTALTQLAERPAAKTVPTTVPTPAQPAPSVPPKVPPSGNSNGNGNGDLSGFARTLVEAMAAFPDRDLTSQQLALLTGKSPKGGYFRNMLGKVRTAGYVEGTRITPAGLAAVGGTRTPPSREEVIAMWRSTLQGKAADIFDLVVSAWPDGLTDAEIAEALDASATGGYFRNMIGRVRGADLIVKRGDRNYLNEDLLP